MKIHLTKIHDCVTDKSFTGSSKTFISSFDCYRYYLFDINIFNVFITAENAYIVSL